MAAASSTTPQPFGRSLTVRPAVAADQPSLARLWREADELHAAMQPGFFRLPAAGAKNSGHSGHSGQPGQSSQSSQSSSDPHADLHPQKLIGQHDTALLVACYQGPDARREAPPDWPTPSLAASTDGIICGLVLLRVYSTPPSDLMVQRRRAHVEELVMAPWARRRGGGRLLMEEGTRWARERGAAQIVLTVWQGNRNAERFYATLGYLPVSRVLAKDL